MDAARVKVQVLNPTDCDLLVPKKAHPDDAGYDLIAAVDVSIMPRDTACVPTGIAVAIPPGYEMQVRSRSGIARKFGVCVLNSPGTIDSGYRGEVCVLLHNTADTWAYFKRGDRIAQAVFAKLPDVQMDVCAEGESLPSSVRGAGGFGSTGV